MKPVVILQHDLHMGPGSLQVCLEQLGVPLLLVRPDKGEAVPKDARDFSGIVLLNSEHSVLDPIQWVRKELALSNDAMAREIPVLGLGYGAQLLTMAAGAAVRTIHAQSYGWTPTLFTPAARARFDSPPEVEVFNAHAHAIELPTGAECLLVDRRCQNKGFALGKHLALLCPLELTATGLVGWCSQKGTRLAAAKGPEVQNRIAMQRGLTERMRQLSALARQVFGNWAVQLPGAPRPLHAKVAA